MPIRDAVASSRQGLAFFGPPGDPGIAALERRGFRVTINPHHELGSQSFLSAISFVVFVQSATKPNACSSLLRDYAEGLQNYDCSIFIKCAPEPRFEEMLNAAVKKLGLRNVSFGSDSSIPPYPVIQSFPNRAGWDEIANEAARYPVGPAPNSALSIHCNAGICTEIKLLLERAFSDCAELWLSPLEGGRSNKTSVFLAHASKQADVIRSDRAPPWLKPYFVKVGPWKAIHAEWEVYQQRVEGFIPFHLGPGLDASRCALGSHYGILVGDYVDGTDTLVGAVCARRAAQPLSSLFHSTLLGWYRSAVPSQDSWAELISFPVHRNIGEARTALARGLGPVLPLAELRQFFEVGARLVPVILGPIHGDLHARNVLVRGGDAIMIDFRSARQGPVLYDIASLEASLLIDCDVATELTGEEWYRAVSALYMAQPLLQSFTLLGPQERLCGLYEAISQLRLQARYFERAEGQYATLLATALLQKSVRDQNVEEPEATRRAAAYTFATVILTTAFGSEVPNE